MSDNTDGISRRVKMWDDTVVISRKVWMWDDIDGISRKVRLWDDIVMTYLQSGDRCWRGWHRRDIPHSWDDCLTRMSRWLLLLRQMELKWFCRRWIIEQVLLLCLHDAADEEEAAAWWWCNLDDGWRSGHLTGQHTHKRERAPGHDATIDLLDT